MQQELHRCCEIKLKTLQRLSEKLIVVTLNQLDDISCILIKGEEDLSEFDPDYCIIHLDQDIAPGGYGWVFPKGDNKVNIGLGVEKTILDKRNKRLGKSDNVSSLD